MVKNSDNSTLELKDLEEESKIDYQNKQDTKNMGRSNKSNVSLKYVFKNFYVYRYSEASNTPLPQRSLTLFGEKKVKEHELIKKFHKKFI